MNNDGKYTNISRSDQWIVEQINDDEKMWDDAISNVNAVHKQYEEPVVPSTQSIITESAYFNQPMMFCDIEEDDP